MRTLWWVVAWWGLEDLRRVPWPPTTPVRLNIPPVEHCFTSLNLILQRNQNKSIHSPKGANQHKRSEGYPYFLILDPENSGPGCSIVDENWTFSKKDFCVFVSPENVTLRAAHFINFQSQRDLFLIFHFLYPHPSILALKHRSRSLADCNSEQREKLLHFHPVANFLCSARGVCL